MIVGSKIKKVRELRNYTQEHLADRLGMSQTGYSKIERGETDVPFSKLTQIAEVLDVKLEDLITFDENNVFNNSTLHYCAFDHGSVYNQLPEKLQQLYEDKIKLLEEQVAYLKESLKNK